jgi:hypothetical protein
MDLHPYNTKHHDTTHHDNFVMFRPTMQELLNFEFSYL